MIVHSFFYLQEGASVEKFGLMRTWKRASLCFWTVSSSSSRSFSWLPCTDSLSIICGKWIKVHWLFI